ncbi:GNAT family N-acetyltransferase [Salinirubellus salinus]|jgi:L-amino acid N-acyltransferase YncA|uniref:GNAT family N-acetyltransferase n=1 Tax=Salinirubellus salinus TaxID=1364945 RepID=A0A9E7U9B9_9EURY|nr:GNAT family N-acetyltransferase [Salinirubellus salinus]UWM55786.1 GNAT family N-acetyltransferase [Salinirubellus salinus]
MQFTDDLEFGHEGRNEVYEYVEQQGTVDYEAARKALGMGESEFGSYVTVLKRDGVLEQEADELRVKFDDAGPEYHEVDGMEFLIRQATQDDLPAVVETIHRALDDETYIVGTTLADEVDRDEVLLRHNELSSRVVFVATVNGEVAGWVHLEHPETPALAHTAELTLGVVKDHRGKGIGRKLLARGSHCARDLGTEKLYNSVPTTNEGAIAFLESEGWETEAIREDHYKIDGAYVDEVMMAYRP